MPVFIGHLKWFGCIALRRTGLLSEHSRRPVTAPMAHMLQNCEIMDFFALQRNAGGHLEIWG
jgi:hypothetical protein